MANTIITKNSSTASAVPTSGDLVKGELAVNVTDKRLFTEDNGGTVVELGTNPSTINIDAGTIDGTTIGATTASTGAFTTLSASSNVTLSGGTANGVLYLNGSKVATSGSALTFDGTYATIGTSGTTYSVGGVTAKLSISGSIRATGNIGVDSGVYINAPSAVSMAFITNDAEQMRLTSTGLGIGTSSPAAKLDIYQSSARYVRAYPSSGLADFEVVTNNNVQPVFAVKGTGTADLIRAYAGATQALTLDSSGNLGLGTSSPSGKLDVVGNYARFFENASGAEVYLRSYYASVGAAIQVVNNFPLLFLTNNTERARIDSSGNVGIGTSSPAYKLDVNGDARIGNATAGTNRVLQINGVVNKASRIAFQESGTDRWLIGNGAASENGNFEIYDATNGNNFILTRSGNLGLGVTPSAWGSSYKAIQLGAYSAFSNDNNFGRTEILGNLYASADNVFRYITSTSAASYRLQGNVHAWLNAASGTAESIATLTQAMTLDASGNLLVGGTSVYAATMTSYGSASRSAGLGLRNSAGTAAGGIFTAAAGSGGGSTDVFVEAAGYLGFNAGGSTERARITAEGFFKASNTGSYVSSSSERHEFNSNQDAPTVIANSTSTGVNVVNLYSLLPAGGSASALHFVGVISGSGIQFQVDADGDVKNTNNSYGAISDIKLKENITDATPKLSSLMQVRVVNYNLKTDPEHKQLGVIAQELEQVFPSMVDETPDRDESGNDLGTVSKGVKYSVFVPMLIKAMQEQQAIIESLKARLDAANL